MTTEFKPAGSPLSRAGFCLNNTTPYVRVCNESLVTRPGQS